MPLHTLQRCFLLPRSVSLLAHAVFYLFSSFRENMPWSSCAHPWNTRFCSERMRSDSFVNQTSQQMPIHGNQPSFIGTRNGTLYSVQEQKISSADEYYNIYMLGINQSSGITDLGSIRIELLLCLIFIFVLMYMCIRHGVKSTGNSVMNNRSALSQQNFVIDPFT